MVYSSRISLGYDKSWRDSLNLAIAKHTCDTFLYSAVITIRIQYVYNNSIIEPAKFDCFDCKSDHLNVVLSTGPLHGL